MKRWALLAVFGCACAIAEIPGQLRPPARHIPPPSKRREIARKTQYSPLALRVGLIGNFDVFSAKVPYSTESSNGLGYSLGVRFAFQFSRYTYLSFTPQYQVVNLQRSMLDTMAVAEPVVQVSQQVKYMGGTIMLAYLLMEPHDPNRKNPPPEWWLEGGFQLLKAVAATQTNTTSTTEDTFTFGSSDRLAFAVLQITGIYTMDTRFQLVGSLGASYNVASTAGSMLWGFRFTGGVQLTL